MNNNFNVNDLQSVRGFDALVQGQADVLEKLLGNCNDCKSTYMGFKMTREDVLRNSFCYESLSELLTMLREQKLNHYNKHIVRHMLEKILRDCVILDMVDIFMSWIFETLKNLSFDVDKTVESLFKSITVDIKTSMRMIQMIERGQC